jgi:lipopolysaccharide assembly outer membrane protein LptD (OstA)
VTRTPRRLVAALTVVLFAVPLSAQKPLSKFTFVPGPKPGGGNVKITIAPGGTTEAEREEYVIFTGDVHLEYQDIKIRADKLTFNQKTKDVTAEGNVVIDQGPTRVTARRALYNLDSKTGTFFQATGAMEPSMYFTGDQIEKVEEDTYVMTNGMFTSCDLDRPAWSLRVKKGRITLDDYAHMQDVTFRTRFGPLLWLPRLIWPTKSDRSQGFLIPRLVLSSGRFGPRLETAYFIPFGDSADATVDADLSTYGYVGAGINVRYRPSENVKLGDLYAYAVRDPHPELNPDTPNATGAEVHWRYRYQHAQDNLPGGFRGVIDVEDFSDLDFFRQFDRDPRIHTLSNIYSSAYLTKNRSRYSINILTDRREILLSAQEQRFEQLPSLQFRMYPQRVLGTPVYFSMESSASHLLMTAFQRALDGEVSQTSNTGYFRSDVFPTLSLQLRTPAWFSLRPQVSLRDTYYSASIAPGDNPAAPTLPTGNAVNRFYGQGQVEFVGPSVEHIFNTGFGGFSRFKHVIEPRIQYVYTTNVSNADKVIRFDTVDSPTLPTVRDSVTYSLTQRLIGKEVPPKPPAQPAAPAAPATAGPATTTTGTTTTTTTTPATTTAKTPPTPAPSPTSGSAREVMSLSLQQTVSLDKPFTTGSTGTTGTTVGTTLNQRFTPLVATLRVNPYQAITVDANTTFGNVSHQVDQTSLSANLLGTGKNSDKYLALTWFATFKDPSTQLGGSSQFRISTGGFVLRDRLRMDVLMNYDATQKQFLEQRYIFGWTGSCYGISFGPRRFLNYTARGVQPDLTWEISFSLKNVGTFGNVHP